MKLIEGLVLTDYSTEYNTGEISREELNLKLELMISRMDKVQLDYSNSPFIYLPADVLGVFNNLLRRYKAKSKLGLTKLIEAPNKASYNRKARYLIGRKLFFASLHSTIQRNVQGWAMRNNSEYPIVNDYFIMENSLEMEGAVNE
ncbi:hypothetical protein AF332_20080 [Sporosarcina globispora]|uniref:Uncharacterized protein n=1 Tax=Sporosarcina globispora TaxID=1459 RepID=A0A0M0GG29_SPOGL|nr:hypothetical protein [Sporosarcina globispora]KON88870.1 hypothetical protein AF332_20080 [Sporosarcina globispora]